MHFLGKSSLLADNSRKNLHVFLEGLGEATAAETAQPRVSFISLHG